MNTFQKYLTILTSIAMLIGTIGLTARRGGSYHGRHHGGYYYGGRSWYGWPYYGYGWGPSWGIGLGYPGYYSKPSYAKDNAGETYWLIYNRSLQPLRVVSDRDETIIPAGALKKLYRKSSFKVRLYPLSHRGNQIRTNPYGINTRQHSFAVDLNEIGTPVITFK